MSQQNLCTCNSDSGSFRIWKLASPVHITATYFNPLFYLTFFFAFRIGFRVFLKWINYNSSIYSKWCLFTSILYLFIKLQINVTTTKREQFWVSWYCFAIMQIIKNSFWNSEVLLVSCSLKKLVVKDYNEGSYKINHYRCLSLYIEELKNPIITFIMWFIMKRNTAYWKKASLSR